MPVSIPNHSCSMDRIEPKYLQAVELIKKAILQSQYNAIRLANQEQLKLYFGIGRYISENPRSGYWGTGALGFIGERLRADLPGLVGFSLTSMKNMRKFYEAWASIEDNSATRIADIRWLPSERVLCSAVYAPYPHTGEGERPGRKDLQHPADGSLSFEQRGADKGHRRRRVPSSRCPSTQLPHDYPGYPQRTSRHPCFKGRVPA